MADKARGWLRKRLRADGMTWLWCYQRRRDSDGEMVENSVSLGLVADIGAEDQAAWIKVGELGLIEKYIDNPLSLKPTFGELYALYERDGLPYRKKDGARKAKGTIETYTYHLNNHILPRWKTVIAEEIRPLEVRNWLFNLHDGEDYVWETCTKIKQVMSIVFDFVDENELYALRNPLNKVTIPASEEEHADIKLLSPEQVFGLLGRLPCPVNIAVLLVAATGVRISECLGLRWKHVRWNENRIMIQHTFRRGEIQRRTKTKGSRAPVPMCEDLAFRMREWRRQSPYNGDEDFIFASPTMDGKQPLWGQTINADFIKPAAMALGYVADGERFGWHCFRHSLSTWINETTGNMKIGQAMLRHDRIETTNRYTHANFDKTLDVQRQYMAQLRSAGLTSEAPQ